MERLFKNYLSQWHRWLRIAIAISTIFRGRFRYGRCECILWDKRRFGEEVYIYEVFDLKGPLYEDIFQLDKYIVNGVDLNLKLFRNRAPLLIMSAEGSPSYKVQLLDVSFKACMIKVDSGVLLNHAEIFKETTAKYPLVRTEVKMNTCPTCTGSSI